MADGDGTADHSVCRERIAQLRHDLLRATDRAVGAEAELERLRGATTDRDAQQAATIRELTAECARLQRRVQEMEASRTWRLGRLIVAPAARLAGRTRR